MIMYLYDDVGDAAGSAAADLFDPIQVVVHVVVC